MAARTAAATVEMPPRAPSPGTRRLRPLLQLHTPLLRRPRAAVLPRDRDRPGFRLAERGAAGAGVAVGATAGAGALLEAQE